jgi:hypothetical protein
MRLHSRPALFPTLFAALRLKDVGKSLSLGAKKFLPQAFQIEHIMPVLLLMSFVPILEQESPNWDFA